MAERAKRGKRSSSKGAAVKRGRKANGESPAPLGEVPEEVYQRWALKIRALRVAHKKTGSELSTAYAQMEKEGVDRKGMQRFQTDMDGDAKAIAHSEKVRAKLHKLNETPLYTQTDMFLDVRLPAPMSAFLAGQQVGRSAGRIDECPHKPGSEDFVLWRDGYESGQRQNHDSLRQASAPAEAGAAP